MLAFLGGVAVGAAAGAGIAGLFAGRRRKMLGRFVSFAAHEINTPITAVNMTVLNLLGGVFGPLPPDQTPWVELMREQIARLNGMIGELRDLIHLELSKEMASRREPTPAQDILDSAVANVRRGCAQSGIPLEVETQPNMPSADCDPDRAPRTLTSLLFHARKFRLSGGIRVKAGADAASVSYEITFDGPLVSQEEAQRSLELYYPAALRKQQTQTATGLGLGILRTLLRRDGGELSLDVRDKRHTLTMRLPVAK